MDMLDILDEKRPILANDKAISFGRFGICALLLIEPAFFLYQMTNWSFDPLNDQLIIAMVTDEFLREYQDGLNKTDYLTDVSWNGFGNSTTPTDVITNSNTSENMYERTTSGNTDVTKTSQDVYANIDDIIQEKSTRWILILACVKNALAVFSTLFICSYTDIVGRKFGVIMPMIGYTLRIIAYMLVVGCSLPIQYLIIGSVFEGVCGAQLTLYGASFAYLADVVPEEKRSFRFTVMHSLSFASSAIVSIATGSLIAAYGYLITLFWLLMITVSGILYVILLLKDSKPKDSENKPRGLKAVIIQTLSSFKLFCKKRESARTSRILWLCLFVTTMVAIVVYGRIDVDTLYLAGKPFYLDSLGVGCWSSFLNILSLLFELIGAWFLAPKLSDTVMCMISGVTGVIGNIIQAVSANVIMLYIAAVCRAGEPTIYPMVRAIMSKRIEPHEQGALQAALGSLETVCTLVSVIILDSIYDATALSFHGLVFVITGALYLCDVLVMSLVYRTERQTRTVSSKDISMEHLGYSTGYGF